jgi:small subunit ribosomal protein S21
MQVFVRDNDVNAALRVLKKKMQREGTFRDMKRQRAYEKPSARRVREKTEAIPPPQDAPQAARTGRLLMGPSAC